MAKNPLEQLISNAPRYADYNPSEERQDTNIIDAGVVPTVVQPYDKTNKWLRFANLLNKAPEVYEMGVDVMQDRAAKKVANMSEGEFQEAYEKIIGGDQGTRDLFGYNKAHQEKIVERAYAEVVPLELKDLVTDFESRLNDFGSIDQFDDAVNTAVDDYFTELDGRFNQSTFANNAHQLLRTGKEAKIKIQLHDAYETQAKEFIQAQSLDNVKNTLNGMNGNYDIDVDGNPVDMGNILTKQYNGALGANGGDKGAANQTVVQGVGNQIKELISTGTTQDLEDAQELFDETFGSDILVGGKSIFDTTEALKLEIDLRKSLKTADDNYTVNAERITFQEFTVPWRGRYQRAKTIAEQTQIAKDWLAALKAQDDDLVLALGSKAITETVADATFSKFEARYETIAEYKKLVPDTITIDDRSTAAIISDMGLNSTQESIFVKLNPDRTSTTLQQSFLDLTDSWQATYDSILRKKLEKVYIDNPDNLAPVSEIEKAYEEAKDESEEAMRQKVNDLVKREEPIAQSKTREETLLALGGTQSQIDAINNLPVEAQEEAFTTLIESKRDTSLEANTYSAEGGGRRAKIVNGDFTQTLQNINIGRETDSYTDSKTFLRDYESVTSHVGSSYNPYSGKTTGVRRTMAETEKIELGKMFQEGDQEEALQGLFNLYEFTGFTEQDLINGFVTLNGGETRFKSNKNKVTKIPLGLILASDPESPDKIASYAEIPILLGGSIDNTLNAIENNDVDAFRSVASKIGYTPEQLLNAQKFALTAAGFIETK